MTKRKGQKQVETIQLERLTVIYKDISEISPNPYNPNRQSDHEYEMLQASIKTDGFTQPVIVQDPDADFLPGHIVDGEHRWRAADAVGLTEIPVVYVNFSEEQMKISTIRHNTARGSHDVELEAGILRDLQQLGALDFAQDALGMSDIEINRLIEDIQAPDGLAAEDFAASWDPGVTSEQGAIGANAASERIVSATPAAIKAMREAERKAAEALTEEDRQRALKDVKVFRLMLSFPMSDKEMIDRVLGKEPASKILDMISAAANDGA